MLNHCFARHAGCGAIGLCLLLTGSRLGAQVVINEIYYDPFDKTVPEEFIELHNPGSTSIDLSGWRISRGVDFEIPAGTAIEAGAYRVIAQDPATILSGYGVAALGPWAGRLSNEGEQIDLRDGANNLIDRVDYQRGFPWPVCPDGASMELIHPALDNDLGGSWRSSTHPVDTNQVVYIEPASFDWHYFKGTSEPPAPGGADWRSPSYPEDASWLSGQTPVGYGDGDDNTLLANMQGNFTSVYLRRSVVIPPGEMPGSLLLRIYVDDGAIVYLNGVEVGRWHVNAGPKAYDDVGQNHERQWEELLLPHPAGFLTEGTNLVAVHVLNSQLGSSDLSIDLELRTPPPGSGSGAPSPGTVNQGFSTVAPPQIRQVSHAPTQPMAGEPVTVTAKVTDPEGVAQVTLAYQVVAPGDYVRLSDTRYEQDWISVPMADDGLGGDALSGDDVFSATLPGTAQTHRHLIRYRITVADTGGATVTVPYTDDAVPNFAYFCYDGVPAWSAALQPGSTPVVQYPTNAMRRLPVYHLIAVNQDIENCQWNGGYRDLWFVGTLVYDGVVYDHMQFRVKGQASTYASGKNKWKFNFSVSHRFQARDNYGRKYQTRWDKINVHPGETPWWRNDVSTSGMILNEVIGHKFNRLAGTDAAHAHFFQLRIIDATAEQNPSDQYDSDFWGVYIAIEQPDGAFLDERALPDGNLYNLFGSDANAAEKRNQGPTQTVDHSDLAAFMSGGTGYLKANPTQPLSWWETNLRMEGYYNFNIMNRALNNSDMRQEQNVNYYHNTNDQWRVIPWDLDLLFEDARHWDRYIDTLENLDNCFEHPELALAWQNRVREVQDLFLENDQAAHAMREEVKHFTGDPDDLSSSQTLVDANQAQWDFHPHKNKKGIWYRNTSYVPKDFPAMVEYLLAFPTSAGWGGALLESDSNAGGDPNLPATPAIGYVGGAGYPVDDLRFQSSAFSDPQGPGTFAAMKWRIAEIANPTTTGYDPAQPYRYEITPLWESEPVTPFAEEIAIAAPGLRAGATYRVRVRHQDDTGRWSHWSPPVEFVAGPPISLDALQALMVSEIHYHPSDPSNVEFIELLNTGPTALDLSNVAVDTAVDFTIPVGTILPAGGYLVVVESTNDFASRYQDPASPYYRSDVVVAGQWSRDLSGNGEQLRVLAPGGSVLVDLTYSDGDSWPERADGRGSSLELIDPEAAPTELASRTTYLNNPNHWRSSCVLHGSPGWDGACDDPVVIQELLAHSNVGLDWLELANTGSTYVAFTDWYVSDSYSNLQQTALASILPGIAGNGLVVVDENQLGFAFSELGEDAILSRLVGGQVRFIDSVDFGASDQDVPFGRHQKSDGETDFTALSRQTPGEVNAYPLVGPIVISEILYHTSNQVEYVELANITDASVPLYDPSFPSNTWTLTSAVQFVFPPLQSIPPNGAVIVTGLTPDAFRTLTGLDPSIPVYGPWQGALNNAGDSVRLRKPGNPETNGVVPAILADKITYRPLAPWPTPAPDHSIERFPLYAYGNDPIHWQVSAAVGGTPGLTTGPRQHLALQALDGPLLPVTVRFHTIPGQRYDLEFTDDLGLGLWGPLQTVTAPAAIVDLTDARSELDPLRWWFYRIRWLP